jgi:hypothetical protein
LDGDQVCGHLLGAKARGNGGSTQERALERDRADAEVARRAELLDQALAVRPQRDAFSQNGLKEQRSRHDLPGDVGIRRAVESHVEAVDEQGCKRCADDVRGDQVDQRLAEILHAA